MKNKCLISGITGFVGTNLKPYLNERNIKVIGISREENLKEEIVSYKNCDINLFNTSNAFIHLAGKAHDLKKGVSDNEYYEANTDLTIKLFNQFLESDCKIFIYLSSVKAVADKVDNILIEETTPNPITVYGKSKLKAEDYILSKNLLNDKKVYILRPCMIHGPNNKGNLNLLYKLVVNNIPFPLGKFQNKRSFLSIDNLCFVIEKIIEVRPNSGVYNIADDDVVSTNELVKIIAKASNKKGLILNIPKTLIKKVALLGDKIGLPLNTEKLEKLTENYCVSNTKIVEVIGEELPFSAIDGLTKTIKSFKEPKKND